MEQLLKELRRRIDHETRSSQELYASIRQLGMTMFLTNTMGRENVLMFCTAMLKLDHNLAEAQKEEKS